MQFAPHTRPAFVNIPYEDLVGAERAISDNSLDFVAKQTVCGGVCARTVIGLRASLRIRRRLRWNRRVELYRQQERGSQPAPRRTLRCLDLDRLPKMREGAHDKPPASRGFAEDEADHPGEWADSAFRVVICQGNR